MSGARRPSPAEIDRARVAAFKKLLRDPSFDTSSGFARTWLVARGATVLGRASWVPAPSTAE